MEEVADLVESLANETLTIEWDKNALVFDKGVDLSLLETFRIR
jgi:hypothetical protein